MTKLPSQTCRTLSRATLFISLLMAGSASAAIILAPIDEFSDGNQASSPSWNRVLDLRITANPRNESANMWVSPYSDGFLVAGLGPGVVAEAEVQYTAAGGNVDLTAGGANGLSAGLRLADVPGDFTTTLLDGAGNSASITIGTSDPIRELTALDMPFENFAGFVNIDLTNIESISMVYSPSRDGADLLVNSFSSAQLLLASVPEPDAASLLLIAGAALLQRRSRKG